MSKNLKTKIECKVYNKKILYANWSKHVKTKKHMYLSGKSNVPNKQTKFDCPKYQWKGNSRSALFNYKKRKHKDIIAYKYKYNVCDMNINHDQHLRKHILSKNHIAKVKSNPEYTYTDRFSRIKIKNNRRYSMIYDLKSKSYLNWNMKTHIKFMENQPIRKSLKELERSSRPNTSSLESDSEHVAQRVMSKPSTRREIAIKSSISKKSSAQRAIANTSQTNKHSLYMQTDSNKTIQQIKAKVEETKDEEQFPNIAKTYFEEQKEYMKQVIQQIEKGPKRKVWIERLITALNSVDKYDKLDKIYL